MRERYEAYRFVRTGRYAFGAEILDREPVCCLLANSWREAVNLMKGYRNTKNLAHLGIGTLRLDGVHNFHA